MERYDASARRRRQGLGAVSSDQLPEAGTSLSGVRTLIVEDEPEIAEIVDAFFRREGAECLITGDGVEALDLARWWRPELIILDLRLPGRDGLSILADLRARSGQVPIIIASALGEDIDKLTGFRLGCDDYVVKPVNPLELIARAKVVLRRRRACLEDSGYMTFGGVRVDPSAFRAYIGSTPLELTPSEFKLLCLFVERGGRLVARGQIVDQALGGDANDRSVDPHVSRLRQKLERLAPGVRLTSVRGEGYRLDLTP